MKKKLLALALLTTAVLAQDASRVLTGSATAPYPFNIVAQPGFEARTTGWSVTAGSYTTTSATANLARGRYSASWTPPASTAAGVVFQSDTATIPAGLQGRSCRAQILYKGAAVTNGQLYIDAYDGTTSYGNTALVNTSGPGFYLGQTSAFNCPTSGSLRLRVRTIATTPASPTIMYFDEAYIGDVDLNFYGYISPITSPGDMVVGGPSGNAVRLEGGIQGSPLVMKSDGTQNWSYPALVTVTSTYAARYVDTYIVGNTTSGAFTITLPDNSAVPNKQITIAKSNSSTTNLLTIASFNGSQTIGPGAQTSVTLAAPNATITLVQDADTQTWRVINYKDKWKVDSNISGANPSLGVAAVSSYTGIENGSLTLTNNTGTGTIAGQIGCSSTNAPSGTTCSAGNESVSISFTPPGLYPQDVQVCTSFGDSYDITFATGVDTFISKTFQIIETATNAQTVVQEGKGRVPGSFEAVINDTNTARRAVVYPMRVCGTLTFASSAQKMIRLMYEQAVSGTINSSAIIGDAQAATGQRDIHWEIYPVSQ